MIVSRVLMSSRSLKGAVLVSHLPKPIGPGWVIGDIAGYLLLGAVGVGRIALWWFFQALEFRAAGK